MPVNPVPEGFSTVTPYLTVADAGVVIAFMKKAFDAVVLHEMQREDGKIGHAAMQLGTSKIMLGSATEEWKAMPGMLYLYLPNVDEIYGRAMAAGGTSLREPRTEFYGDRVAAVKDAQGNQWWLATHVEDVSDEEMQRRATTARG
jgi:PhnB protein